MRVNILIVLTACMLSAAGCGTPEERAAAHLARAQQLFEAGDLVKAELEAKNAAQIEPKNAEARYLLALIAENDERYREMLGHLQIAIDSDPSMAEARIKLGTLYRAGEALELARQQADAALEIAPDNTDARVLNARLLYEEGEVEAAFAEIDAAYELDPLDPTVLALKTAALAEQQGAEVALEFLDEAIASVPGKDAEALRRIRVSMLASEERTEDVAKELASLIEDVPGEQSYRLELARVYAEQGRVDEAEQVMRDLAAAEPDDVSAKLGLVGFLAEARDEAAAEEALKLFVAEDPDNQELRFSLGQLYESQDRRAEATEVYEEAIAIDPLSDDGLAARNRLVALRVLAKDEPSASRLIEEILADAPDNADALLTRAALSFAAERYDDAIVDLRVVLRNDPERQRALLLLARSHVRAGDPVLAKDAYRRLLEVDPAHPDGNRELVALSVQDGELAEAETLLRGFAEANPDDVDAGTRLVEVLALQEKWEAAETEARRVAATEDPDGVGSLQLARVLEGQGRHSEAAKEFRQVLNKNPKSLPALQGLTRSLTSLGRRQAAIDYLRRHLETYPEETGARLLLGGVFAAQGKRAEAAREFEAVIAANPGIAAGYLALVRLEPDNPPARIEVYRRALDAIPANPELSLLLASEYERLARYDEAIEVYETLLNANPDLAVAKNNLAALLLDFRYKEPASLQRAVKLAQELSSIDNPAVLDTVGWAHYRAGDHAKAIAYLERATAAAEQVPELRYHLGMAYLAADNPIGAKQELDKALQLAEADFVGIEEARATLAALQEG